jgi:hypothetical protein
MQLVLQVPEKLPVSHVLAGNQHEGPSEVEILLHAN